MTESKDFLRDVKSSLQSSGDLGRLQAAVRTHIIDILNPKAKRLKAKPTSSEEIEICNNLIREYLEWNAYIYTSSMFVAESGLTERKQCRDNLAKQIGFEDDEKSDQLPLLLNLLLTLKKENKK